MKYNITKKISCADHELCMSTILDKLESETGLKFHAETETDTVNGSISILHTSDHIITVTIYDKNENPNNEHKTTLKKPNKLPTEKQCKDCLA